MYIEELGWADIRWLRRLGRRGWDGIRGGVDYCDGTVDVLYLLSVYCLASMYVCVLYSLGSGAVFVLRIGFLLLRLRLLLPFWMRGVILFIPFSPGGVEKEEAKE